MSQTITAGARPAAAAALAVLGAISMSHLLNDMLQSLLPAIYPLLRARFGLSFGQIGAITLVYQLTASVLQPVVGAVTDRRPYPFSLPLGMVCTLAGMMLLSAAGSYALLLVSVGLVGVGSSVFHPESSRVARLASGGRHGMAQSVFQVGGNAGAALGPLLAASVVVSGGQRSLAWCALAAVPAILLLTYVGQWYRVQAPPRAAARRIVTAPATRGRMPLIMALLVVLMLSKFFYMASMGNYYTFYLIDRFHLPVDQAQYCLFAFLAAVAAGTMLGGPIGDRIGRKRVILASIVGVLPITLALPYLGFWATVAATVPIGLLLASAFPALVVYAQELMPDRVGAVSGLMFGLAFGLGGVGAASLGLLADAHGIDMVFRLCAFLPALGLLAAFLPEPNPVTPRSRRA